MANDPAGRGWRQPAQIIAGASAVVAVLALVLQAADVTPRLLVSSAPDVHVLFETDAGVPSADIVIVGQDGRDIYPDARGMATFAERDVGLTFEVLDRPTRRWLRSFALSAEPTGILRVRI